MIVVYGLKSIHISECKILYDRKRHHFYTFCLKNGNRVAHNLAKHARHVKGLSVWVEDIPPHLYDVLFADPG